MTDNHITTLHAGRVIDHAAPRPLWTEHLITATGVAPSCSAPTASDLLAAVARRLAEQSIEPLQEKLYGTPEARSDLLAARAAAWSAAGLDPSLPVTYVEYQLVGDGDFAGQQVWGLTAGDDVHVETVTANGRPARQLRAPGLQALLLSSVQGLAATSEVQQAEAMFRGASAGLADHDLRYNQVVRTWIYFARLLDWYDDFNAVRSAHHEREEVGAKSMPASTGIQGRMGQAACFMDVLAVQSVDDGPLRTTPIRRTARQDGAFTYGSAFSRGLIWQAGEARTVFVSGTASINGDGDSVHIDNAEAQTFETLMAIAGVLAEAGGRLEHIAMATVFCKNLDAFEAFRRITQALEIAEFPAIFTVGDVCRHDLLIEIEAVATCMAPSATDGGAT